MTKSLSTHIDPEAKRHLDSEKWQAEEIQAGITELEAGQILSHERVSEWLRSWGKPTGSRAPR